MVMSSCIGAIVYILLLSSILYSGQPQLFVEGSKWHPQHSAQESNVHGRSAEISTDTVPHAVNNRVTKVKSAKGGPPPKTKVKKFKGKGKGSISKSKSKGGPRNRCSRRVYKPPSGCLFTCAKTIDTTAINNINTQLNSANPIYTGTICAGQYSLPTTTVNVINQNTNAKASLTLSCCGPSGSCIIDGTAAGTLNNPLFYFQTPAIVSFAGLTFQNIAGTGIKGALLHTNVAADVKLNFLTVQAVSVSGTTDNGGAIYFNSGTIANIKNSIFTSNSAGQFGGAIAFQNSRVYLTNNAFRSNSATGTGGAVAASQSSIIATCNLFKSNTAGTYGGAVNVASSSMNSLQNIYDTNTATKNNGGAIALLTSTLTVNEDIFATNTAPATGIGLNVALSTSCTMFYCNAVTVNFPNGVLVDSTSLSLLKCIPT